jgi:hypothetical protein
MREETFAYTPDQSVYMLGKNRQGLRRALYSYLLWAYMGGDDDDYTNLVEQGIDAVDAMVAEYKRVKSE